MSFPVSNASFIVVARTPTGPRFTQPLQYKPAQHQYSATSTHQTPHTHTRLKALFSGTTRVSRYQKGKINLDFTEPRDSEWQWHPLGHMQVCTLLQTENHASTPPLSFSQAGCPYCRLTKKHQSTEGTEDSTWKYTVGL